jgi:AcrR family transcriptional regulator
MANVRNNVASKETQRRLIAAAGEVFAELGFERATIKEITRRAGASQAAVNYHFSDKAELYDQVVREAQAPCVETFRSLATLAASRPAEERLRAFVEALLSNVLDPRRPAWHGAIMAAETRSPSKATSRMLEEILQYTSRLEDLVLELRGRPTSRRRLRLMVDSIFSQCLFHADHTALHAIMFPDDPPASQSLGELTDHIVSFSLAGIRG